MKKIFFSIFLIVQLVLSHFALAVLADDMGEQKQGMPTSKFCGTCIEQLQLAQNNTSRYTTPKLAQTVGYLSGVGFQGKAQAGSVDTDTSR